MDNLILITSFLLSITLIIINVEMITTAKKKHIKLSQAKKFYFYFNYALSLLTLIVIGAYYFTL